MILLRNAVSFCRIVYLIRTTPIELVGDFVRDFDDRVLKALGGILGEGSLEQTTVEQSGLSVKMGGLGLRKGVVHCGPA